MREGHVKRVQSGRAPKASRKRSARSDRLGRDERAKILRVQNLLAKAHSTRFSGVPRTLG
jgi:hypothetical protein